MTKPLLNNTNIVPRHNCVAQDAQMFFVQPAQIGHYGVILCSQIKAMSQSLLDRMILNYLWPNKLPRGFQFSMHQQERYSSKSPLIFSPHCKQVFNATYLPYQLLF